MGRKEKGYQLKNNSVSESNKTPKDKTIIITKEQANILSEQVLNEGISSIVYHFTSIYALYKILLSQKFYLKTGVFRHSYEHTLSDGKRMYYLSTTRNKNAYEGYSNGYKDEGAVRITLDGEKLSHKYKGSPTNYWGDDSSLGRIKYLNPNKVGQPMIWNDEVKQHRHDETEDRIWSFHPTIPNIMEYIKRIDIFIPIEGVVSDYETRIEKAKTDGKEELVRALQSRLNGRIEEEQTFKSIIYDIYNLIGRRGILFLYNNEKDFAIGNKNTVKPEWLEKNDFYKNYDERQLQYSINSNIFTNNALFNILANALAIMVFNEKPEKRQKLIIQYCKQYGFQRNISHALFNKVDSILYRNSNIFDISKDIDDNIRANNEDLTKVQNMVTHWMRKNGYHSLRDVVSENKEITKVRQGIIAYEETEPDYEIGFESPDASSYAHVINESPDSIENFGLKYKDNDAYPFIVLKDFPNDILVSDGGTTHWDIVEYLESISFDKDDDELKLTANEYDLSFELLKAVRDESIRIAMTNEYSLHGRYWAKRGEKQGNIISFYGYTIKDLKNKYNLIDNILKTFQENGISVDINTVVLDHWIGSTSSCFPLKWVANGMAETMLPISNKIIKDYGGDTPLYIIYGKNGNVITVDVDGNYVKHQTHSLAENHETIIEDVKPEDVDLSSFKIQKQLNPKFWKNNKLDSRIRLKLLDIADDFTDFLKVGWVDIDDITMTGSLANYNWDENYSDIDLHIILDYKKVDERIEFVKEYFNSKKNEWNQKHENLKIFGFPVEVYVQDKAEKHNSSGVYSLEKNEWIIEPKQDNFNEDDYDETIVKTKVSDYMNKIDDIEDSLNTTDDKHKIETVYDESEKLFNDIKDERANAFKKSDKELSDGNLVFKTLRRNGYLDKISTIKNKSYDEMNSINC